MTEKFGLSPSGVQTHLYTITGSGLTACVTDFGATLVRLLVPDAKGQLDDVVLGFDSADGYAKSTCFLGAIIGRNANRTGGASFLLNGKECRLAANEGRNNLHSGPDCFHLRLWKVESHTENAITLSLHSPDGDQGFPGNADIQVTYRLENKGLHIIYDGVCDQDTVFNLTNHAYFNLAGHDKTYKAMDQLLTIHAGYFNPDDAENIPTGELRTVAGTPMDFRTPKAIGRDIGRDYDALSLQGGFDHNWILSGKLAARLEDPASGRAMEVHTDCPGIQFYAGNFLPGDAGKGGVIYGRRSGVALETQYFPDALNHPLWPQPVTKAGEKYHSETVYQFI